MSFGGSVAAMITSLKNNARPKRNRLFDRKILFPNIKLIHKRKATPEELEQVQLKIQNEKKVTLIKNIAALVISVIIVSVIFYMIYEVYDEFHHPWFKY